eukprot:3776072-Amphidinium_carterae.1
MHMAAPILHHARRRHSLSPCADCKVRQQLEEVAAILPSLVATRRHSRFDMESAVLNRPPGAVTETSTLLAGLEERKHDTCECECE